MNADAPPESGRARLVGRVLLAALVAGFFAHRLLVALSAGDFLYPLEPSEAKNTQIAWDLMSGRFGTPGFELNNYIVNTGSIHHASYSSAALAYWMVSKVLGFTALSVRMVPLLAWVGALLLWGETLRRRFGATAMALGVVGLWAVPTLFIGFQLTFLGCHPESVLPLAATIAAWLAWLDAPKDRRRAFLFALCAGYSFVFSYLLWPFLALMAALSLLPPWPRPDLRAAGAAAAGAVVGLWPLWLLVGLGGASVLMTSAITESPDTTLLETAKGMGLDWEQFRTTFSSNLPYGFEDYWMSHPEAPRVDRFDLFFEEVAYRVLVFGPLLLLPWAVTDRDALTRRLAVLVAIAPALVYTWLCFASPWKPHVPVRYFVPFALLGFSAPGVAIGLGLRRLRRPGWARWTSIPLLLAAVGWLAVLAPPRWQEATSAVRPERFAGVLEHRYVAYYNLGIGTVWSPMVADLNDLIDVRSASADPHTFDGMQAALWGAGARLALGRGDWDPPPMSWDLLRAGLREWGERNSYRTDEDREDPAQVARNVGWGAGLRSGWDLEVVAREVARGRKRGEWPEQLPTDAFWEGLGEGWGRARPDAGPDQLPERLSPSERESAVLGMERGRAQGPVPPSPRLPGYESVRGPAT